MNVVFNDVFVVESNEYNGDDLMVRRRFYSFRYDYNRFDEKRLYSIAINAMIVDELNELRLRSVKALADILRSVKRRRISDNVLFKWS